MENKKTFFCLKLIIGNKRFNDNYLDDLNNQVDIILSSMSVSDEVYKFETKSKEEVIYLFRTENRKRKGQLVRKCEQTLEKEQICLAEALTKASYEQTLYRLKKNRHVKLIKKPNPFSEYKGEDIAFFNDPKNWYSWQNDFYNLIFNEDGSFKDPHPRHIISLIDKEGNTGKSSFLKWLSFTHPNDIGRLGYGTTGQLRSAVINIGTKKLYIIDLTRAKGKEDREEDLLSVTEDIKSGNVFSSFFGSGKALLMSPPHIVISTNYELKYNLLSEDRWRIYEIKNKKLKNITARTRAIKAIKK